MDNYIYIVLSFTGSTPSRFLRKFSNMAYTHSSISYDSLLREMYSFGRKKPNNFLVGGFVIESIGEGIYKRFPNTTCKVLRIPVSSTQLQRMQTLTGAFCTLKDHYHYSFRGVFLAYFKLKNDRKYHMYCTEFVRFILSESGFETSGIPEICHPSDFEMLPGAITVYEGLLKDYIPNIDCND